MAHLSQNIRRKISHGISLKKVSTLISANLHYMVDQALQSNSLAVIDQYIRQVENNLADLEDAAATVGGEVKCIKRRMEDHQAQD